MRIDTAGPPTNRTAENSLDRPPLQALWPPGEAAHRRAADVDLFVNDDGVLEAHIATERLSLRSVGATAGDLTAYQGLFACPQAMARFATGTTWRAAELAPMVHLWTDRWQQHDPFSSFAARLQDDDRFVGQITLGHGPSDGQAQLAYALLPSFWRQGLATEGLEAVVWDFLPAVTVAGYLRGAQPLATLTATARPDNAASCRLLEHLGFSLCGQSEAYGAIRQHFQLQWPMPAGLPFARTARASRAA